MAKTEHGNVFNQSPSKDSPEKPDSMGDDLYFGGWPEIMKMHLSQTGDMIESENAKASRDAYGGPAKGEPDPAGMKGK